MTLATTDGAPASGLRTTDRPNGQTTKADRRKHATPKGIVTISRQSTTPATA